MKKILITGANSYVGTSFENYVMDTDAYVCHTVDTMGQQWQEQSFRGYDVVFHVAGIAHADVGQVDEQTRQLYYQVNTELAVAVAKKAKQDGVRQFIFMSSMIVYSGCNETTITHDTVPHPENFYGDSKWQAEQGIQALASPEFKVVILRPPMIYGKGSKGNYPKLAKLAQKTPFFPRFMNQRSMLYIDNLCEFVRLTIENDESGVFFPQNAEYTQTSEMVRCIAAANGHKLVLIPGFGWIIKLLMRCPGKLGGLVSKVFGSSVYEQSMSEYAHGEYRVVSVYESIIKTEA